MDRDQIIGALITVASLAGIAVYAWLLIFWPLLIVQLTAFIAVGGILLILAWIGWTMATTPPPQPLEAEITPPPETPTTTATPAEPEKKS